MVQKRDRSALIAAELVTRAPLVADRGSDMELHELAYGGAADRDAALQAA